MHDAIMQNVEKNLGPLYFMPSACVRKTDPGGEKTYQITNLFILINYYENVRNFPNPNSKD